ncbi:MAG TPA: peptide-methionine (R)-S-oxide reductase MsrB [Gemmatimonadales bacterium]|nr:peptide-methionine (R)-S-oxide reductase MsrB [Gemmatimonadales bacterium]
MSSRLEAAMRDGDEVIGRRSFLVQAGVAMLGMACRSIEKRVPIAAAETPGKDPNVTIVEFSDDGKRLRTVSVPRVVKSEDEWKKELSPSSFEVTRHAATERPFTGPLLEEHRKGVFRCICCDTALYNSSTKFESGTGWPSFWAPIAEENIVESTDNSFGMVRTEVSCRRCEAHLGHVFDDGPKPTGLRYCMNSVALRFAKAS